MEDALFKFKQFEVFHSKSSMKVGVDAVLLGAWAGEEASKILDVGCGCGVISLMLAQRFPEAEILGIDIDKDSIEEANLNFKNSKWSERLMANEASFPDDVSKFGKFDLIVSNPPFFKSGVLSPKTPREKARHQDLLSIFSLLKNAPEFLLEQGVLSIIYPFEFKEEAYKTATESGLSPFRECLIRGNRRKGVKRIMSAFKFSNEVNQEPLTTEMTLYDDESPSRQYLELCKDFYLKF